MLVEHALARFSTDNLSCMVVRFNSQALADTVSARTEPIGVEGDPASTVRGGVTESEAIVSAARRSMEGGNGDFVRRSTDLSKLDSQMVAEQREEAALQEPGPELNPDGIEAAKRKAAEGQREVKGLPADGLTPGAGGPS